MATKAPISVEIRSYQVGFGDCFLLSFIYSKTDKRHVLIDFGSTGLPKLSARAAKGKPKGKRSTAKDDDQMLAVARAITEVCATGELVAVVATHRHADHISGFATNAKTGKGSGDLISALKPRLVLQPWTEDPAAARDAKTATTTSLRSPKRFVAGLDAMHDVADMVLMAVAANAHDMSRELVRELSFLGEDNIKNLSAVTNLIAMGTRDGAKAVYANHGSKSGLERLLPGVKTHVLGPPTVQQSARIRKMRSRDPDQFWHLLAGANAPQASPLVHGLAASKHGKTEVPANARWFRDRLDRMRGEQLLEIVRTLDAQMNNTSLILLFEVLGKKLLFPGDAQIENWSYALEDAPDAKHTRALLADVDVYKVGHHGSLNATPKELLWKNFAKKGPGKQLKALLSTMPGKHGKTRNQTEVPRKPLLTALQEETTLASTDDLTAKEIGYLVEVKRAGVEPPKRILAK
jgi:hypothetical protein